MMNDKDIIKTLECCVYGTSVCKKCHYNYSDDCQRTMMIDALALIKRQQAEVMAKTEEYNDMLEQRNNCEAEIERLKSECGNQSALWSKHYESIFETAKETIRAEAIKDVLLALEVEAESSDKYIREYDDSKEQKAYNQAWWNAYTLVKEMLGKEDEGNG